MEKFNQIVSKIFEIPETDISDTLTSKDISRWDSMNYLLFISEIEKEFNMIFTMDEVICAKNIGDIRKTVESKTGN